MGLHNRGLMRQNRVDNIVVAELVAEVVAEVVAELLVESCL